MLLNVHGDSPVISNDYERPYKVQIRRLTRFAGWIDYENRPWWLTFLSSDWGTLIWEYEDDGRRFYQCQAHLDQNGYIIWDLDQTQPQITAELTLYQITWATSDGHYPIFDDTLFR